MSFEWFIIKPSNLNQIDSTMCHTTLDNLTPPNAIDLTENQFPSLTIGPMARKSRHFLTVFFPDFTIDLV